MGTDDDAPTVPEPIAEPAKRRSQQKLSGDRYLVGERLGRGGMGEVLSARDVQIGRDVAIKRMLADAPGDVAVQRFIREAQIQGRLEHPAIVPVHEIGRDADGKPFFAMKKLTGTTIGDALGQPAKFSRQRLLRAFADVCLAIELAHTRGIVHRDLKPSNIMLGDFGEVYVLDWGVAKVLDRPEDLPDIDTGDLTARGIAIGTPGYMAPEQVKHVHDLDGRADIYALGCILFEILAGQRLHPKGSAITVTLEPVDAHASRRAPERAVAPELDGLCVRATAIERADRPSARELGEGVQRYLDGDRDLATRRNLAQAHLEAAQRAYALRDDEDQRRTAIQEAGRAIALDPAHAGAAELVSRLMLEPPQTVPKEVEASLVADDVDSNKRHARASRWVLAGYLAFLPFLLAFEGGRTLTLLFLAVLSFNATVLALRVRGAMASDLQIAVRSALPVAVIARAFSPFWIAPAVAIVATGVLMYAVGVRTRRGAVTMAIAMSLAILVPWLLEAFGVLSSTVAFLPDGIAFHTHVINLSTPMRLLGIVMIPIFGVFAATIIPYRMRRTELSSRRRLYLYAWQLRQLVP